MQRVLPPEPVLKRREVSGLAREFLGEGYVSSCLTAGTDLKRSDLPAALIAAKRAEMQVSRLIKRLKT